MKKKKHMKALAIGGPMDGKKLGIREGSGVRVNLMYDWGLCWAVYVPFCFLCANGKMKTLLKFDGIQATVLSDERFVEYCETIIG